MEPLHKDPIDAREEAGPLHDEPASRSTGEGASPPMDHPSDDPAPAGDIGEGLPSAAEDASEASHADAVPEDASREPAHEHIEHEAPEPVGLAPHAAGGEETTQAAYDAVEQALDADFFADEPFDDSESAGSLGYIPMQARPGALQYQPGISVRFGRLPNKVDLRPLMGPVGDQGGLASCVAHAVAGAYEYWLKRVTKQTRETSPLFVYYNARWREGRVGEDAGSSIQLCLEALSKFGACSEAVWPLDPSRVAQKPGADAYQDAAPPRVQDMAQVPLRLQAWKQALAEGKPIIFGIAIFEAIEACADTGGVVPMPAPDDVPNAAHALHAMCAVGYSDVEKVFIVRNSRGPDWGDGGHCYLPYAYVLNPRLNDGDCWVFVSKSSTQPPRDAWSDDSKPVVAGGEGVHVPMEAHTIEDYANVAVDLFEPARQPYDPDASEDYARHVGLAGKSAWTEMERSDREGAPAKET